MGLPVDAVAGPALVSARSVEAGVTPVTVVVAVAVLLAELGSVSLPETVAELVMSPAVAGAVALIVIVALAALAREPTLQVTVPEALVQVSCPARRSSDLTPVGRVSVTTTPVA